MAKPKVRTLNKKERIVLKNEQKRLRIVMELSSIQAGYQLRKLTNDFNASEPDCFSDLEEHVTGREQEWRSLLKFE